MPQIVSTSNELLELVQLGDRSPRVDALDAADSIRSLLALNLKNRTVIVPEAMVPHYRVLAQLKKNAQRRRQSNG